MKSHIDEAILPAHPRFHTPTGNGLYRPIPFAFVTERMHSDIVNERHSILAAMRSPLRDRQSQLFDSYDPKLSLNGFKEILEMFGVAPQR